MAAAFSALTRAGAVGTAGWMGAAGISGVMAAAGASGGTVGITGVSKLSAAGCTGCAAFAKKSDASVSTASATMGCGAGPGAGRSGFCPKVPPGPTMSGSMGSLPPSFTSVWSGPRSTSKEARGRDTRTCTGVMAGAAGSGWASGWPEVSAGGSGCGAASGSSASISSVTLWPQCRMPFSQSGTPIWNAGPAGSSSGSSSSYSSSASSSSSSASAARAAARSARRSALCRARAAPFACTPPNAAHSHCQTSAGVRSKMYRLTQSASTAMIRFAAGLPQSSSRLPPSSAPSAPPPSHAFTPLA